MKMKSIQGLLLRASVPALLVLSGCAKQANVTNEARAASLPPALVETVVAAGAGLPVRIEVTGVVQASDRATIAPKVMGTIRSIPVDLGQTVKKGDLLVKIEAAEISAKVLQAEAQLTQANRDLAREKLLLEKGASTEEIVDNLTDRVAIMEALVQEARVMFGYTDLRAPFDGSVSRIYSGEGSLSAPGMPLLELQGREGFEVEASIPESLVGDLEIGAAYSVELPSSEGRFEALLKEVSSGFDVSSRTVAVRFSLPSGAPARAGQFAKIQVLGASRDAIVVPEAAVSRIGQMERLFVVRGGVAELRLVKTGVRFDGKVEIVAGLDAGEPVVVKSEVALVEGQALTLVR